MMLTVHGECPVQCGQDLQLWFVTDVADTNYSPVCSLLQIFSPTLMDFPQKYGWNGTSRLLLPSWHKNKLCQAEAASMMQK